MPLEFFIDGDTRREPLTEEEKAAREEKALRRMFRNIQIEKNTADQRNKRINGNKSS